MRSCPLIVLLGHPLVLLHLRLEEEDLTEVREELATSKKGHFLRDLSDSKTGRRS